MGVSRYRNQYQTPANKYPKRLMWMLNNMRQRCKRHPHYKGRGISVCPEWSGEMGAVNFYEWALANGYKSNLSIDRVNNSLGYSPSNCRWIPRPLQPKNRDVVKNKGELHHIEILPSGSFRVTVRGKNREYRNVFSNKAEAIKHRDIKLKEEEEYAWSSC